MEKDNYTLIERYLNGELNDVEKKDFQNRLKSESEFSEEYTLQKSMNIFLEKDRNQPALQSKLASIGKDFFLEEQEEKEEKIIPINRNKNRNRWLIGLIATAAVAALLVFFNPFQDDLYHQYANHNTLSLTEKSTGDDLAANAQISFNQGNYSEAYANLTNYLETNNDNQRAQLALGISALELGKNKEAIDIFNKISNGSSQLKNYGTWYLALTYVKQKDIEKAKSLLDKILASDAESTLKKQAKDLVLEL